jgi:hypothetical protein
MVVSWDLMGKHRRKRGKTDGFFGKMIYTWYVHRRVYLNIFIFW